MLLVFGKKSDIEHPLIALSHNIDSTTSTVTTSTLIIVLVTIGVVMLLVCLFVWYITYPLAQMIDMSQEIVHIAAEDEDHKDYTSVLHRSFNNMSRSDEVGLLALDYYHIVCLLHNKNIEKKCTPKYPENPFYCVRENENDLLTWPAFFATMQYKISSALQVNAVPSSPTVNHVVTSVAEAHASSAAVPAGDDLDVLASLGAASKAYVPMPDDNMPAPEMTAIYASGGGVNGRHNPNGKSAMPGQNPNYVPVSQDGGGDMEMGIEMEALRQVGPRPNFSAKAHKSSYVKLPSFTKQVTYCASMKSQLYALCALLLAGVIATMVVTILELRDEGSNWMNESGDDLLQTQVVNLQSITDIKAVYVKNFFAQLSLDLLVGQAYFNELIDLNLTRSNYIAQGDYLPSYSADPYNPYASTVSKNYSSYFVPTDAGCQNTVNNCKSTHNSNQTRLSSLFDLKLRSYYHSNNIVSFMQFGLDADGFTRYLPYTSSATYAQPTSCFVGDTSYASCFNSYYSSACYSGTGSYPVYDPRCRPWYQVAAKAAASEGETRAAAAEAYFQYPRVSSSGAYVMTAVVPIVKGNALYGVLNSNFLATTLSDSINSLQILDSGYVYLIDSRNTSIAILHPDASSSCQFVSCAEDFSHAEYLAFHDSVLMPLQNQDFENVAQEYTKKGDTWQLSYATVKHGSIDYTLIATVPRSEILKASTRIQHSIDQSANGMIAAFVVAAAFFLAVLIYFAVILVRSIVNPIHDLHAVLERAKSDDLTGTIPSEASSLDMKILMEAFTKFMISLRFGSDSYARGNPSRALEVFIEALELYRVTKNLRGVGASLNNLAVVELSLQHHEKAQDYNHRAVDNAKELLAVAKTEEERKALHRTLSDREGNLAVMLLEENKYAEAFAILERLLLEDKRNGYIKGCVVKQGTLGQYYLKQGEIKSAEKIFNSALDFVSKRVEGSEWNRFEASTALQIALFNMALLKQAQKVSREALVHAVLECLSSTENLHTATTTKALVLLRSIFSDLKQEDYALQVDSLAEQYLFNIHLSNDKGQQVVRQSSGPKKVAFVIDYSGSMSGTKIRSAIENVNSIFENHIYNYDSIMLVTFNQHVNVVLYPTMKEDETLVTIRACINSVTSPNGSTALYDAIHSTLSQLNPGTSSDWIIALTDGEDNGSKLPITSLLDELSRSKVNLIVMGIGSDVQSNLLESLTKNMKESKGIYIAANGDKKSIDEAFTQVAMLIQGQLILEDM